MRNGNDSPRSEQTLKRLLCAAVSALLLLSLIPIALIARYDYPMGDDQLFGASTAEVYRQTHSVSAAFTEAARVAEEKYVSWQGTFSGIFLMALHPGVFDLSLYALTPFLLIGALIAGSLFFSGVLMLGYLRTDKRSWLLLTLTVLFFSIQLLPSAREGFFWYNGGIYYTFFHSLFLTLGGVLLLCRRTESRGYLIAYGIVSAVLAGLIGGANYATALPCGIALVCAFADAVLRKRAGTAFAFAAALLTFGTAMYFSITAPGNAVRQAAVTAAGYAQTGAPEAILLSLALAAAAVVKRFDMSALLLVVMTVLLVWPCIGAKTHFTFPKPAIVCLFVFGVFASQFTPSVYASTSPGPERLRNLAFFNFYWMCCFDAAYITGWYLKRKMHAAVCGDAGSPNRLTAFLRRHPAAVVLSCGLIVAGVLIRHGLTDTTSACATLELWNGTAASHGAARYAELTDAVGQTAEAMSKLLS